MKTIKNPCSVVSGVSACGFGSGSSVCSSCGRVCFDVSRFAVTESIKDKQGRIIARAARRVDSPEVAAWLSSKHGQDTLFALASANWAGRRRLYWLRQGVAFAIVGASVLPGLLELVAGSRRSPFYGMNPDTIHIMLQAWVIQELKQGLFVAKNIKLDGRKFVARRSDALAELVRLAWIESVSLEVLYAITGHKDRRRPSGRGVRKRKDGTTPFYRLTMAGRDRMRLFTKEFELHYNRLTAGIWANDLEKLAPIIETGAEPEYYTPLFRQKKRG